MKRKRSVGEFAYYCMT